MTVYRLNIEAAEPNPDYDAQMREHVNRKQEPYYGGPLEPYTAPQRFVSRTALSVDLTTEQWQAVQRAVLEVFK